MLYKQIQKNKRQTTKLTLLFIALVFAIGWAVGYLVNGDLYSGAIITGIILVFYIPITYISANRQVLRLAGAREVTPEEYPQLFNIVEELVIPARIPMPKIYVVNDPAPNAFAAGIKPEKASIGVTQGLLDITDREELEGVIAHEIAHIQNYDTRLMTISIALVGVIVLISEIGSRVFIFGGSSRNKDSKGGGHPALAIVALLLVVIGPLLGQLIKQAVSRNREYLADATAVELTRNPQGLIGALSKIDSYNGQLRNVGSATAGMYIADPIRQGRGEKPHMGKLDSHRPSNRKEEPKNKLGININPNRSARNAGTPNKKSKRNLMSTHPPIEDRIQRLSDM